VLPSSDRKICWYWPVLAQESAYFGGVLPQIALNGTEMLWLILDLPVFSRHQGTEFLGQKRLPIGPYHLVKMSLPTLIPSQENVNDIDIPETVQTSN
jgi:hypothetical protein